MDLIRPGDRYRVVIEGPWEDDYATTPDELARMLKSNNYEATDADTITVEKIEPPIETFGPGDFVKDKRDDSVWYITPNGYVRIKNDAFDYATPHYESKHTFTSEHYERIEL